MLDVARGVTDDLVGVDARQVGMVWQTRGLGCMMISLAVASDKAPVGTDN